jgi:Carbohydrate family 9 binding domain-like
MKIAFTLLITILCSFTPMQIGNKVTISTVEVNKANTTITLDGIATESSWTAASWNTINNNWIGASPTSTDYQGRYKILYDKNYLYVLAEITDDVLIDSHLDGLTNYWDDDCLEIFIDEDASGGLHLTNYNAFAYHIALDKKVVDYGLDNAPHYYNSHVQTFINTIGNVSTWEVAIKIYPDNYIDGAVNIPSVLKKGKKIGFSIAYNDSDATSRENMIGSVDVPGTDKNRGYIDASTFGKIVLK